MAKVKLTAEQYAKAAKLLGESKAVKGGINRVNKITKSEFKSLEEDLSSVVTRGLPGVSGTQMKNTKEVPMPKHLDESMLPELHQAIHHLIENIWLNPSQKGLDKFFVERGITWGDIMSYLTTAGIVAGVGEGLYKVKNYFKRKFSKEPNQMMKEKGEEISKIAKMIENDPAAPWSKNKLKDPQGQQLAKPEVGMEENYYTAEPHPDSPEAARTGMDPEPVRSNAQQVFKPLALGYEVAILSGPDGKYAFMMDNLRRDDMPNPEFDLTPEDVADYVNDNIQTISKGDGLKDFEKADLVKIDEPLKAELMSLYAKDTKLMRGLQNLEETTGAASSGAFVAPLAVSNKKTETVKLDEKPLDETTTAASSGQYVQPQIWAKDKKNWAGDKKTQYPGGEMVDLDSCTKLNNNKAAENGKCSQGAVDHVVKTHKTKNSVISKNMYEEIAKKTGRSVEDIAKLIESKIPKTKSL